MRTSINYQKLSDSESMGFIKIDSMDFAKPGFYKEIHTQVHKRRFMNLKSCQNIILPIYKPNKGM